VVPRQPEGQDPQGPGRARHRRVEHRHHFPYGYKPDRVTHYSVPVKAQQGRTRTRLAVDPDCGPWVTQMFERSGPSRSECWPA
jgi:hypothetical protein